MKDNNDFFNDIETIFRERDEAIKSQNEAITARQKNLHDNDIFFAAQKAIKEQTSDIRRNDPSRQHLNKKTVKPDKSIKRPRTSRKLEQVKNGIDEILDMIRKNPIATTLIASAAALGILISLPTLKTNSQVNYLTNKLGDNLEKGKYVQQQDGIFKKYKLNIEPTDFIESMKLTSNSHMRLYILSTVIQDSDFNNILRALGYNGIEDYVKDLGYRHNDDYRASEQYNMEYEDKLRDLIKELNKHPEYISTYLDEYPELGFIYDRDNTYLIDGIIGTTRDNGRSL